MSFLSARASEFKPGGVLVLAYIARTEEAALAATMASGSPSTQSANAAAISTPSPSGTSSSSPSSKGSPIVRPNLDVWAYLTRLLGKAIQRLVSTGLLKPQVARLLLGASLKSGSFSQCGFDLTFFSLGRAPFFEHDSPPAPPSHSSPNGGLPARVGTLVGRARVRDGHSPAPGVERCRTRHGRDRELGGSHDPGAYAPSLGKYLGCLGAELVSAAQILKVFWEEEMRTILRDVLGSRGACEWVLDCLWTVAKVCVQVDLQAQHAAETRC